MWDVRGEGMWDVKFTECRVFLFFQKPLHISEQGEGVMVRE